MQEGHCQEEEEEVLHRHDLVVAAVVDVVVGRWGSH